MKTTTLLAFALLLNCQTLFAQSSISVGLIGGPMAANFRNHDNTFIEKEWMASLSVGAAVRFGLDQHFFIQTEIGFERKGFAWRDFQWTDFNGVPSEKFNVYSQFNYATLTPTIGFATNGKIHFEGSLGIFGGYLTSVKSVMSIDFGDTLFTASQPNINTFNRLDYGMTARLGTGFELTKKLLLNVSAIGNLGLDKPYKPLPTNIVNLKDKTLSVGLQLGLFYKI